MKKHTKLNIQIDIIKEGKTFIAYSPALDLASCGKTITEARNSFAEAASSFFESIIANGQYRETLLNLGWHIAAKEFVPPTIVGRELSPLSIPALA